MIFQFYCDESYDGNPSGNRTIAKGDAPFEPASYIVGGFFADQATWNKIDVAWANKNQRVGVERYHAAHLNGATYEFAGWSKNRRLQYSRSMLRALKRQKGKLHGISCGLYVDEYRRIINAEGQEKLGHPYLVCFKSVIAAIAKEMDRTFRPEDRFSVVLDQNKWGKDAVELFYWMKGHPGFRYASRLEDCESGDSAKCIGLQVADFVAYESFKLMHGKRNGATEMRKALASMLDTTGFLGYQFGEKTFLEMKQSIEETPSGPNMSVVIPHDPWDPAPYATVEDN
jgi:hypothetical protein